MALKNKIPAQQRPPYVWVGLFIIFILIALASRIVYSYASTPEHVRHPADEHAHLRLQVSAGGRLVDFSKDPYQHPYDDSVCSGEIAKEPFHFHDNVDQMLHIHWRDMTGGELLKYYGWNFVGGRNDILGSRFDNGFFKGELVPIHGFNLPERKREYRYFIYTGDESNYQRRDWQDFLRLDLETILETQSRTPENRGTSWLESLLMPRVFAHGDIDDGHEADDTTRLERVQNLIGNIVIFAQENEPSDEQVEERFEHLLPLTDSSCAG